MLFSCMPPISADFNFVSQETETHIRFLFGVRHVLRKEWGEGGMFWVIVLLFCLFPACFLKRRSCIEPYFVDEWYLLQTERKVWPETQRATLNGFQVV